VEAGVDSIEHGTHLFEQPGLIGHMAEHRQFLVPTLGMFFCEPLMDAYDGAEPGTKEGFKRMQPGLIENFRRCKEAGVKIAAGTDNTYWEVPGLAWELHTYVKHGGMTPMEALVSGTRTCAELCHLDKAGTLEPGRYADLLVVEGDPTKDIAVLQRADRITEVFKEGMLVAGEGRLLH